MSTIASWTGKYELNWALKVESRSRCKHGIERGGIKHGFLNNSEGDLIPEGEAGGFQETGIHLSPYFEGPGGL